MHRIVGAGLLALDVVISDPDAELASTYAGGTCGNVLSILGYFGWQAVPIATIGDDDAGKRLLADLKRWKLPLDRIVIDRDCRTPVFVQTLHRDSHGRPRHSFTTECPWCGGALNASNAVDVHEAQFEHADAPDFFFMDRLSRPILLMAASARRLGATVVYEPSVESDRAHWTEALALVDVLKYSEDRFQPAEFDPYYAGANVFWEIQTLGTRGLRFRKHASSREAEWSALEAVEALRLVDTCGAGDWCTAGFLFAVAQQCSNRARLENLDIFSLALRQGQAYAAWACGFEGARGAMYANDARDTHRAVASLLLGVTPESLPHSNSKFLEMPTICEAAHGLAHGRDGT